MKNSSPPDTVIPAQARIHQNAVRRGIFSLRWIPACAGMTILVLSNAALAENVNKPTILCQLGTSRVPCSLMNEWLGANGLFILLIIFMLAAYFRKKIKSWVIVVFMAIGGMVSLFWLTFIHET